jgi:hypothetical protein
MSREKVPFKFFVHFNLFKMIYLKNLKKSESYQLKRVKMYEKLKRHFFPTHWAAPILMISFFCILFFAGYVNHRNLW